MTAVEWLIEQLTPSISLQQKHIDEYKNQAKQMEKQQIEDAFTNARYIQSSDEYSKTYDWNNAEQYYNETFKSE